MKPHQHAHYGQAAEYEFEPRGPKLACSYCGSAHPRELALAIRSGGVTLDPADRKYGWPHKFYLNGQLAPGIKFYTEHLQDASEEDRDTIERALDISFTFTDDGVVSWKGYVQPSKPGGGECMSVDG